MWTMSVMDREGVVRRRARRQRVEPGESLARLHPAISAEWHPSKNGSLTPADVIPRSTERVFWRCTIDASHVWQIQVISRVRHHGCPFCAGQAATPATCLRALRPEVAALWHPSRNGRLTPDDVMPGSARMAWWRCDVEPRHVWQAKVMWATKAKTGSCPFCAGRRVTSKSSLQARFPRVAAEWHPTLNGELRPRDVLATSNRRVFWLCGACEHVWQTALSNRVRGSGCAACLGRVATPKTSLLALFPEIAREWHPTLNGGLTPDDVRPGSCKRVAWRCAKSPAHTWETTVGARTLMGSGCPFCSRTRVSKETSLAALFPRLAREWHPTRNAPLTPRDVLPGYNRKVWWRCRRDPSHEWASVVSSRSSQGVGCPMCARKVVTPKTSLAALHPGVAREWHPTKNAPLTPRDVLPGSGRSVWWKCKKGPTHVWRAMVSNRTARHPSGCPVCSGRLVTPETSLRTRFPKVAAEWHPTKNRPMTPDDIVPGSNKRVWWMCTLNRAHVWNTVVANRTRKGYRCPFCAGRYVRKRVKGRTR